MPAKTTIVNIVEVGVLLVALGCGMAASIMIGVTSTQMGGCVLKASVARLDSKRFTVTHSSQSRCQFCLVTQVVGILLALVFIAYRIQVICRGKLEIQACGRFVVTIVFGVMAFFVLVEACLVTVGLKTFCNNLLDLEGAARPNTCAGFQRGVDWKAIDGSAFYYNLTTAEAASWISLLCWLCLTGISLVTSFCLNRRIRALARAQHTAQAKPVVT
ncbi:transmembrane protein 179B-like [Acanthaster planci]|uniref:Transmembrane protein 179B-like n=1 Tax=Acanthaster planci TaxID=133434 RepID=A0A8B7YGB0_ACAPL|nr:transmembrane protein 179B-like [Acanthaster planci]